MGLNFTTKLESILRCLLLGVLSCTPAVAQEEPLAPPRFRAVECTGTYAKHLQGICTNQRDAIYWCFTTVLVKTDLAGQVERQIPIADHHGDICFHDGKLYVAVNLGEFNRPAGRADSWIYCYDSETLVELNRYPTPEVVHGAGGIAHHDGRFVVVGGLPEGFEENYLYQYDESFAFQKRHTLPSGYTLKGIQTATFHRGYWWLGCYGSPRELLKVDKSLTLIGRWNFDCSLGIVGLPDGDFLVARGACERRINCTGQVERAVADDQAGLRRVASE